MSARQPRSRRVAPFGKPLHKGAPEAGERTASPCPAPLSDAEGLAIICSGLPKTMVRALMYVAQRSGPDRGPVTVRYTSLDSAIRGGRWPATYVIHRLIEAGLLVCHDRGADDVTVSMDLDPLVGRHG